MPKLARESIVIPRTVPSHKQDEYIENYLHATQQTGRLFLFAGDQKIEHLHEDFYGPAIPAEVANPEHLFKIAANAPIGVFATQLGLIARYASDYPTIPYIVKLNSKTNIIPTSAKDPCSRYLSTPEEVLAFRDIAKIPILGMGYTIYLGSFYEDVMLTEAMYMIQACHAEGMLAILWIYPRGQYVQNPQSIEMISGAAGVGLCLGADFVKVTPPHVANTQNETSPSLLKRAVVAAGNTKLICSGGSRKNPHDFLAELHAQIHIGGTQGSATGRNIYQNPYPQALTICRAIAAILQENATIDQAVTIVEQNQ